MTAAKARRTEKLTAYDDDVLLWSQEQAKALRDRRFADLDIEHLADEIEDVGKSEKRELASRFAVLLAHLLKWTLQPPLRGNSWRLTIRDQRQSIEYALKATPSLKTVITDSDWRSNVWRDALAIAEKETGIDRESLPDVSPWPFKQALDDEFWPD